MVLYPRSDDGRKYCPRNGFFGFFFSGYPPIKIAGKRHKFSATFPILKIFEVEQPLGPQRWTTRDRFKASFGWPGNIGIQPINNIGWLTSVNKPINYHKLINVINWISIESAEQTGLIISQLESNLTFLQKVRQFLENEKEQKWADGVCELSCFARPQFKTALRMTLRSRW